jgi:hypothetical protein
LTDTQEGAPTAGAQAQQDAHAQQSVDAQQSAQAQHDVLAQQSADAQHDAHAQQGADVQHGAQTQHGAQAEQGAQAEPSEEELRAAYEAELNRITSSELIIQTAVSLLNVGGRRLGLAAGSEGERDLEQVRDAIDGVRALMPILERHSSTELRPLRDALAQLQMAYAREAAAKPKEGGAQPVKRPGAGPEDKPGAKSPEEAPVADAAKGPGPAEASGRLWVPGR